MDDVFKVIIPVIGSLIVAILAMVTTLVILVIQLRSTRAASQREWFSQYFIEGCLDRLGGLFVFYIYKHIPSDSPSEYRLLDENRLLAELRDYGTAISRFGMMAGNDNLLVPLKLLDSNDTNPQLAIEMNRRIRTIQDDLRDFKPRKDFELASLRERTPIREVIDEMEAFVVQQRGE